MYVKVMDTKIKKDIVDNFTQPNGRPLRVIVCTSAFGLVVDCPNVRTVIHFKSPSTLMQFVQESGRVGRDGESSKSILFVRGNEFGHYKAKLTKSSASNMQFDELESMKGYATNKSICRRFMILNYFDGQEEAQKHCQLMKPENCCDICSQQVGMCVTTTDEHLSRLFLGEIPEKDVKTMPNLSDKQKCEIREQLMKFRDSLQTCEEASLFGVDQVTGFTESVIEEIVTKCDTFSSADDVCSKIDLWCNEHGIVIYNIINSVRLQLHW